MVEYNKEVVEHLNTNLYFEIKPSELHGVGTFLIRDVNPGTNLAVPWTGPSGSFNIPFHLLEENIQRVVWRFFGYQESISSLILNKRYIKVILYEGLNLLHHSHAFVNHSYTPNVDSNLISLCKINKGEELVRNYHNPTPFIAEKTYI